MSDGRAAILGRIREALRRDRAEGARFAPERPEGYTRPGPIEDPLGRFVEKVEAASGTLVRVGALDEVPDAVGAYLAEKELPTEVAAAPALRRLPWPPGWTLRFGSAGGGDRASVTPCFAAVAETGTLALLSGSDTPTTLNFLPDHHLVVVETSQVVSHLEDVWDRLRRVPGGIPRTINLITGPSRTADVEQTLQLGAHGPLCLHVILVGS